MKTLAWSLTTSQNSWQLEAVGLTDSWDKLLPDKLPYLWAQRLAGLDFLSVKPSDDSEVSVGMIPSSDLAHMHMETTINSTRARLVSRIDLQKQLDMLSQSKLSQLELLPAALQSEFPARVISKLKSWHSSEWEKYNLGENTKHLVDHGAVDSDCSLYKAVVTRDKGELSFV